MTAVLTQAAGKWLNTQFHPSLKSAYGPAAKSRRVPLLAAFWSCVDLFLLDRVDFANFLALSRSLNQAG